MKKRIAITIFLLTLTTFGSAQGSQRFMNEYDGILREGAAVMTPDLMRGKFQDVLATGVIPIIGEAIETEDEVEDPAGNSAISHVIVIPFIDPATAKRGYFMSVSVRSLEGARLFDEDTTVFDRECTCLSDNLEQATAGQPPGWRVESQSLLSDAKQLRDWIKARNWSAINNWVAKQIKKGIAKATITYVVKKAFEYLGYTCPSLNWKVPFKAQIYMATCWKYAS